MRKGARDIGWGVLLLVGLLSASAAQGAVTLSPDYANITLPPNIAPLNLDVQGVSDAARVRLQNGEVTAEFSREVRIKPEVWQRLLAPGGAYTITVEEGEQTLFCATNTIAQVAIAPTLAYRLIPPSYENYQNVGIYWRDLTTFEEKPLYTNLQSSTKQCVNCHHFNQGDPGSLLFHLRASNAGTVIFKDKDDPGVKRNFKVGPFFSSGVYPAWHPSGKQIAFSVNDTLQCFYYRNADKIEVLDSRSDMMLYDLESNTAHPIEIEPGIFDCFPAWSPNGAQLYSVAATPGFDSIPEEKQARSEQAILGYTNLCYNLIVRDYDAQKKTFTTPKMVINASKEKRSITFPRVSPDGRWLVFTLGPQGVFHIWHHTADLWMLDLQKRSFRPLNEINSPDTESYHSFTPDGHWMVFSSRRDDGTYTRPYFTHFNAETGTFTKPFIIPQESPAHHEQRMLSYNIPEFATGPITRTPKEIRRLAEQPATNALTP
jgi:Tol biopolymer transport system component